MQKIQVKQENEYYSCEIGISKDEWLAILQDRQMKDGMREALLCFYYMPEHRGTCTAVGKQMGKNARSLNNLIRMFGQRVQKIYEDRFEVVRTDGEHAYWIVPMNYGREVANDGEGVFEWELREELADAIRDYLYGHLVEQYKKFRREVPIDQEGRGYERYKWQLITASQGKTPIQILADHVAHTGKAQEGGFENLIDASRDNKSMKYLMANKAKEYEKILNRLADERLLLDERLADFKNSMAALLPKRGYGSKANDERTAATILTCIYPDKYTFYKHDGLYANFCEYLGVEMQKAGHCYSHYLDLIQPLAELVSGDDELQKIVSPSLQGLKKSNMLLAQDILYVMMVTFQIRLGYIYNLLYKTENDMDDDKINEHIRLLEANHNLILTGAPGTGKTYMAQEIAKEMGAVTKFVQFHPSYDYTDFVEGLRPVEKEDGTMGFERKDGVFKEFCREAIRNLVDSEKSIESLTKEMSWQERLERFIEDGIENGTTYKTVNGSEFAITDMKNRTIIIHNEQNAKTTQVVVNADEILELLTNEVPLNIVRDIRNHFNRKFGTQPDSYAYVITKAVRTMKQKTPVVEVDKVERKPFVFIIDEINRGEASKIFGELFYAIDPGYRGKTDCLVQTQYQNLVPETDVFAKGFYVPENVYILATMNDIDRSVESMDFAMRRRFTWKEVTPSDTESMLDALSCATEAKTTMARLNKAIAETDGLGTAYQIGPSYFLKLGKNGGDFNKLWDMNIEPLLKEYLRGFRKTGEILDKFKAAYFGTGETESDLDELIDE